MWLKVRNKAYKYYIKVKRYGPPKRRWHSFLTDNIGLLLKNIFKSGELVEDSVTEKNSATAADGKN